MPTLQCTRCGAKYYTAAADQLLELVVIVFDCEICGEEGPLHLVDGGIGYLATDPEQHAA